jgi:nucleotide-binding universal stress UspA family protein
MSRHRPIDLPDPTSTVFKHVLLASEGRKIPDEAIRFAANLARHGQAQNGQAKVDVLSVARIWGTSFGLPNPGLLPTRKEWDEQRDQVAAAVKVLQRRKVVAAGHVIGARHAGKRIIAEAQRLGCDAIVMAAEAPRHWLIGSLLWSQEPYRVRRRARLPVYVVEVCGGRTSTGG